MGGWPDLDDGPRGPVPRPRRRRARALPRAFARLGWPAFGVLVVTGNWNVAAVHYAAQGTAWKTVLFVKIVVVVAGRAGRASTSGPPPGALALWGSVAGAASVAALAMGILLAG